jgi:hypothetical protein
MTKKPKKENTPSGVVRIPYPVTLENILNKLDKYAALKNAIIKEWNSHPDYILESESFDDEVAYVVLERYENGVKHSIDIEMDLRGRDE